MLQLRDVGKVLPAHDKRFIFFGWFEARGLSDVAEDLLRVIEIERVHYSLILRQFS
jgi:hypothetical protein